MTDELFSLRVVAASSSKDDREPFFPADIEAVLCGFYGLL
jgi:hypothetical protein